MQIDLSGRTAFVSGSTQGIGLAIAKGLAAAGAHVYVNGRSQERVDEAIAAVLAGHPAGKVSGISADVSTAAGAKIVFGALPAVDILVNNLGVFGATDVFEIDDELWQHFWDTNVLSGVRLTRHYAQGMRDRGWGRVQFIASESAVVIPVEMVHYGVTKTALLGVSRGYAKALAGTGVTVNSVIVGPTHTEGVEEFVRELVGDDGTWEEAEAQFIAEHRPTSIIQRLLDPAEVANMTTYLASEQASGTTGGALRVDGGQADHILP
ncbi:MAG: SDR family oxidoreductase [Solirubrobacteraceae bacterium]|nr:SDR family oxidoreductase [Solirubrobacteraceae bacterium]